MAVRSRYNNPEIGKAAEGIAALFAPPKATDVYAYAHAASERGKEQRLGELFRLAQDPNTPRDTLDRLGIGAGVFNPNQSYYSVDEATRRALAENAATNARELAQERLRQQGALDREYAKPVIAGENQTVFLPGQTAEATGLPGSLRGNINLKPGETTITPGGETFSGAPKPPTLDEWKAGQADTLRKNGALTDQQIVDLVAPPGELVKVDTPNGPQFSTRSAAIGQTPYEKPTADRVVGNYRAPDGSQGVAVFGDNGKLRDAQTGAELPAGVQTFRSQAQGSVDDVTKTTQGALERRRLQFERLLNTADLLERTIAQGSGNQGLVGAIRGTAQDAVATMHELGRLANVDTSDLEARAGAAVGDPKVAAQLVERDGTISPVRLLSHVLASQGADVLAGGDRTSNQQLNQMISALGQDSLLSNPQRTRETLATLRAWINSQRSADENAFGAGRAPVAAPASAPSAAPSGYKILNVR